MTDQRACFLPLMLALALAACGDDADEAADAGETGSPDYAGKTCEVPDDCYPEIDHEELQGEVRCDLSVEDGYCTHTCETDEDCCAVEGECESDFPQVCASFEANTQKFCFLACEEAQVGDADANEWCAENAHPRFLCRSTGGGAAQRRVCLPDG